jgi:hypothetical protein
VTTETIETTAISGEVITTDESSASAKAALLKENEQIVKRNWKAATEKAQTVYKALTIIHTYDLWKLHKDEKGKRKYTAFDAYLFGEFGWELSRVRALQVIKQTRSAMIEAGELPASTAEPRKRTAPEVTAERAAKVTADQLQKALDAFAGRIDNMDSGDPDFAQVSRVYEDVRDALNPAIADLRDLVARIEAESEAEATDEAAPVEVAS